MNFKDDFPELANSLRKQIKTRRELLGKSQKELLAEINDSFAQNFDISSIVRLEKEDNKNPDKNLNLQLIYYVLRILDLKFDAILFPPKIQTLFDEVFFNQTNYLGMQLRGELFQTINTKLVSFSQSLSPYMVALNNKLLQSGIKIALPPQISIISQYSADSTSLIDLMIGIKEEINVKESEINDTIYLHKDYKPEYLAKDVDQFTFSKKNFSIEGIYLKTVENAIKESDKIVVKFVNSPILKLITIFDTKFEENTFNIDLLQNSIHNFIIVDFNKLNQKLSIIPQILIELNNKFGDNSKSYTMANDYLYKFSILFSEKSFLLQKERELFESVISKNISSSDIVRIDLKDTLKKTIFKNFYSYDITVPASWENLRNNIEEILEKSKSNYIPVDVIPAVEQLKIFCDLSANSIFDYYRNLGSYLSDIKSSMSETNFNSCIHNTVEEFINNELCGEFFNKIDYIKFKENTNCINVTKEFLESLSEDINSEIYILIHSTILKQSIFDNVYLQNRKIKQKNVNWDVYRSRFFSMIEDFLEKNNTYNERFVDEYILDISNANRPTQKYFKKRFTDFQNKEGKTLAEKISTYIINIIGIVLLDLDDESVFYSNLEEEVSSNEIEEYISLYKTLEEYQKKMICMGGSNA